jgi:hypothetical protein
MKLFFFFFWKKRYKFMWNKLAITMYTRLWVRAKIFCCDGNGTLYCYRKNAITKFKIFMVTYIKIETS